ncbi:MAG TPA: tol-pal system protein YbgF, partial [Rhizobiaceae bacterium]|nr:tol-pal system protein YbgF [Rhizobiaceae bacterium]
LGSCMSLSLRAVLAGLMIALLSAASAQAQAVDPRLTQLEEENRRLNGRLEDMAFQLLQMQDQIRRMQEDFEFRFQELEKSAGQGDRTDAGQPEPAQRSAEAQTGAGSPRIATASESTAAIDAGNGESTAGRLPEGAGAPPADLGQLKLDDVGAIIDSTGDTGTGLVTGATGQDGEELASLTPDADAQAVYDRGYQNVLSGDYRDAEREFRHVIDSWPNDPLAADAKYWLGESLLAQKKYDEAADAFVVAQRDHPSSRKAPETLMKLGISLVALGDRDLACATFEEALTSYPNASPAVRDRITRESATARC